MSFPNNIKGKIEEATGEIIKSSSAVGGGCISNSQIISCLSGASFFLKINDNAHDMFVKEANGLKELEKANALRVPKVIALGDNFILLEHIVPGIKSKTFFENFGSKFARLHRFASVNFGFYEDNYIGSNVQKNIPNYASWKDFYWNNRVKFQLKLCRQNGFGTDDLVKDAGKLEDRIDIILEGSEDTASLLHGDLWGGNYITDENGNACLIDPAVYYGNREADLAMTKLFGGFSQSFYRSYEEEFPLPPGYHYRENFYKLYHVLNHLNIFGSGYYNQAVSLIRFYL